MRTTIRRSLRRRAAVALTTLFALTLAFGANHTPARAAGGLAVPAPAGEDWAVASGYNTATHSVADGNDPYALDIVRTDAPTAGTPVLAPISGTVGFVDTSGSRCISIKDAAGMSIMMCHLSAGASVSRSQKVARGQQLGTVAAAGDAANNGLSHMHIAISSGSYPGSPIPFSGAYALDGVDMPATTVSNGYSGVAFHSTNVLNHPPTINAGVDQTVPPGAKVTLTAKASDADGDALSYTWSQVLGTTVKLTTSGATTTFTAPTTDGMRLRFTVTAVDPGSLFAYDTIEVLVSSSAPIATLAPAATSTPTATPISSQTRTILSGSLPAQGFGGLLWGGGSTAELVSAAACSSNAQPRFWVVQDGKFVGYITGAASFVNAQWTQLFATSIPAQTILIGSCG